MTTGLMIIIRHHENIKRLIAGEEKKIKPKKDKKEKNNA